MEMTLLRSPNFKVTTKTGSEGPRHDPYHYRKLIVENTKGTVTLHEGLAEYIEWNGERIEFRNSVLLRQTFANLAGATVEQIERWARKKDRRCHECGCRSFHSEAGFPGESLFVCDECGNIQGSMFDISAVE